MTVTIHYSEIMVGGNVLIGVTGSVATIKLPLIVQSFISHSSDIRVKIVTTERARHFFDSKDLTSVVFTSELPTSEYDPGKKDNGEIEIASAPRSREDAKLEILGDEDEWARWNKMGDPVLHIELCKWADVFVIAPLDANTLGKLSNGLCDNLLTCVFRAWDTRNKPLIFCPAMNTRMWTHPITEEQVSRLISWGHVCVPPISKKLACGDEGTGAMAEYGTIVDVVLNALKQKKTTKAAEETMSS